MFKPVTGDQLSNFDAETQELYKKRENDPRLSYVLATAVRRTRHAMPVIVDQENPYIKDLESQQRRFKWQYLGMTAFFCKCHFFLPIINFSSHSFRMPSIQQGILSSWYHCEKINSHHPSQVGQLLRSHSPLLGILLVYAQGASKISKSRFNLSFREMIKTNQ